MKKRGNQRTNIRLWKRILNENELSDDERCDNGQLKKEASMLTKFNRFAIFPKMCNSCHRYIFLEKYRRADVFHHFADVPNGHPFWRPLTQREFVDLYNKMPGKTAKNVDEILQRAIAEGIVEE